MLNINGYSMLKNERAYSSGVSPERAFDSSLNIKQAAYYPMNATQIVQRLSQEIEYHEKKKQENAAEKTASLSSSQKIKKKKKKQPVTACVANCKYQLVKKSIESVGMVVSKEESQVGSTANLIWSDMITQCDTIQALHNYQRINHFPNMGEICRKDSLARNMAKLRKVCPNDYNFVPKSWIMPSEYLSLCKHAQDTKKSKRKTAIYISKPSNGAMGNGIHLFRNPEKLNVGDHRVVQEYLNRPLLLDEYKFDLRLYVLVTHCDPLRAFLYQDGLVRLSTEKYCPPNESNLDQLYMHLTNYSVNKFNENFQRHSDLDQGSKRSVKSLMKYLAYSGHDTNKLWRDITDLVVKTLIVSSPHVAHSYRMCRPGSPPHSDSVCFEVLGFDIFIDRKLKPWLLEVNRAPSFGGDENIDVEIKNGVIRDALVLVNIRASDKKRNMAVAKAEARRRLFKKPFSQINAIDREDLIKEKEKRSMNRKKKELYDRLAWVRKDAVREEYEDAHLGNYRRIFPCVDATQRKKYTALLTEAFRIFHRIQSSPFKESIMSYYNPQQEDEILQLIEECEEEEGGGLRRGEQQLSSMPLLVTPTNSMKTRSQLYSDSDTSDTDDSEPEEVKKSIRPFSLTPKGHSSLGPSAHHNHERASSAIGISHRLKRSGGGADEDYTTGGEVGSINQLIENALHRNTTDGEVQAGGSGMVKGGGSKHEHDGQVAAAAREREMEHSRQTLEALKRTTIKFPGKSDLEADMLLEYILDNWEEHKPKIAHYWLVQLDTAKRRKVIEIVQGNVRAVVERVWKLSRMKTLKLNRIFNRVFNRMQWNRGQGLWNCFLEDSKTSWEVILNNRVERDGGGGGEINQVHVECCRRIVQLCKDCLLIVYQFANESKRTTTTTTNTNNYDHQLTSHSSSLHRLRRTSPSRSTGGVRRSGLTGSTRTSKHSTLYSSTSRINSSGGYSSPAPNTSYSTIPRRFTRMYEESAARRSSNGGKPDCRDIIFKKLRYTYGTDDILNTSPTKIR